MFYGIWRLPLRDSQRVGPGVKEALRGVQTNHSMSQHRYRQNKVKREHSIVEGLLPILERIASTPGVQSVTPGRISPRSRPGSPGIRFQYPTESGLKLLARSNVAVQEVFVVTDEPDRVIERLQSAGILQAKQTAPGRAEGNAGRGGAKRSAVDRADADRADVDGTGEGGADAGRAEAEPNREKTPKAKRARRNKPRRGRKEAARPKEAAPQPVASTWSEILERHERLLVFEERLLKERLPDV